MKRLATLVGIVAVLAFPAIASAHTADPDCGGTLTLAKGSATADIIRTSDDPDTTVHDNEPGNGTYAVSPGTYKVVWSDEYTISGLEVEQCEQTEPTPTPTPTATPTATPSPTATPTPSPSPAQPSPSSTPTPGPTVVPSHTPTLPPLPPTDTEHETSAARITGIMLFGLAFIVTALAVTRRVR